MSNDAPLYSITPDLHGVRGIRDQDGEVASFGFDPHHRQWWLCANTDRYTTIEGLPAALGGQFHHRIDHIADIYRMFGIALPGEGRVAEARAARRAA